MADITNLKVTKETKAIIDELVKKYGGKQRDFLHKMAVFFKNTGTNPDTFLMPSPAEEIKKLRDTLISFMRKQESDFIKPTFGKMNSVLEMVVHFMDDEKQKKGDDFGIKKDLKTEVKKPLVVDSSVQTPAAIDSQELAKLQNELEKKQAEFVEMRKHFMEVCESVEKKTTGMNKKNVVTLDEAKFHDIFSWLKATEI